MLRAGFILLTIIFAALIFAGFSYAANRVYPDPKKKNIFKFKTALLVTLWLIYAGALSSTDFFLDTSLPGRIPCFLFFPFVIFIFYFSFSKRNQEIIAAIPLHWLIYVQTFRIAIELLLFGVFMEQMMPWSATFEGFNVDIGIGITAPFIGFLAARKRLYKSFLRGWNIAGLITLMIVLLTISMYAYHPQVFNQMTSILGKGFGTFPFTYMSAFFMPLGIFMHVLSLIKIRKEY